MERLEGEARDRVRAASLWLIAALVIVFVGWGLWSVYSGPSGVSVVPSEVVSVSGDGRTVTVELVHGSCQEPAGVTVEEDEDVVLLTARVTEHTPPPGSACTSQAVVSRASVALADPVGERELRTAAGPTDPERPPATG